MRNYLYSLSIRHSANSVHVESFVLGRSARNENFANSEAPFPPISDCGFVFIFIFATERNTDKPGKPLAARESQSGID